MVISNIFYQLCICCTNPIVHENEEDARTTTISPLEDVSQPEVFPVSWKSDPKTELDLQDFPEIGTIVARPDDVDQPEVRPVSWPGINKGAVAWGGEEEVPVALEEEMTNYNKQNNLPLPWEHSGPHVNNIN